MNRRDFVKTGAAFGAYAAIPKYSFAAVKGDDTIKVGVVGVGTRGKGAVKDALLADKNLKVVALADIFQDQMDAATKMFSSKYLDEVKDRYDVPQERQFVGQDALDKLLAISEIDVVVLCTPPVFRPYEMKKCLEAGKHIVAEKPVCVDATQARYIENEIIPLAKAKQLSIASGTQGRVIPGFIEGIDRLKNGQIGEIVGAHCFYYSGNYYEGWSMPKTIKPDDMEFQLRRWLAFIWASGDQYVEQHIHTIDICMWALGDGSPLEVIGSAGRDASLIWPYQGDRCSHFAVDYDFGNGLHMGSFCRQEKNTTSLPYTARIFGTKGVLELPLVGSAKITGEKPWESEKINNQFGQIEKQAVLYRALRKGEYFDNVSVLLNSNWVALAGREAAYSGKKFKYDWIKHSKQDFLPQGKFAFGKREITPVPSPSTYKLI